MVIAAFVITIAHSNAAACGVTPELVGIVIRMLTAMIIGGRKKLPWCTNLIIVQDRITLPTVTNEKAPGLTFGYTWSGTASVESDVSTAVLMPSRALKVHCR